MSRYRGIKDQYKHKALIHYGTKGVDRYRPSKLYPRPYRKPRRIRKYSRPQVRRRGRSRLPYPKPRYFQSQKPEKKYELKPKPEKLGSPPVTKTPRYTLEKHGIAPRVDAEQIAEDVEKRLDSKLTERLLEKFESEFEELLRKVEGGFENSAKGTVEQQEKFEASEQEMVGLNGGYLAKAEVNYEYEQKEDEKTVDVETAEELTKEPVSLEGGFILSDSFGLAIPFEANDAEVEEVESQQEVIEKDGNSEAEQMETIEVESQGVEADVSGEDEVESVVEIETPSEIEVETPVQDIEVDEELPVTEQAVKVDVEPVVAEESIDHGTGIETLENVELFPPEVELIEQVDEIEPERVEPTGSRV